MNPTHENPAPNWPEQRDRAETDDGEALARRWDTIKSEFVDDPKGAVVHADQIAAELIEHVRESTSREHEALSRYWQASSKSTEDLRLAFGRYQALVDRLLSLAR
jgi:hypothetical protein